MGKRGVSLFLVGFVASSMLVMGPAQAACQPTVGRPLPAAPAPTDPVPVTTDPTVPGAVPAEAATPAPPAPIRYCAYRYSMQWPVLGGGAVGSSFGVDRDGGTRLHAGNDIMAPKMTPVVAVRDGTITSVNNQRGDCCWLILTHDDGWRSWYLHLNNDSYGTDDGMGIGIRPDIVVGTRVVQGEVIGWVGDSGNAEPGPPHLHFELHRPGIGPIDPYPALRRSFREVPALANAPEGFMGAFTDDDGYPSEPVFDRLVASGAFTACDQWGAAACPALAATNLDAASWIAGLGRILVPVESPTDPAALIAGSILSEPLCGADQCPPPPLTKGDVAAMLLWAVEQIAYEESLAGQSELEEVRPTPYWDLDQAWADARLRRLGLLEDCTHLQLPLDALISRSQLAEMVGQAFGYLPIRGCGNLA